MGGRSTKEKETPSTPRPTLTTPAKTPDQIRAEAAEAAEEQRWFDVAKERSLELEPHVPRLSELGDNPERLAIIARAKLSHEEWENRIRLQARKLRAAASGAPQSTPPATPRPEPVSVTPTFPPATPDGGSPVLVPGRPLPEQRLEAPATPLRSVAVTATTTTTTTKPTSRPASPTKPPEIAIPVASPRAGQRGSMHLPPQRPRFACSRPSCSCGDSLRRPCTLCGESFCSIHRAPLEHDCAVMRKQQVAAVDPLAGAAQARPDAHEQRARYADIVRARSRITCDTAPDERRLFLEVVLKLPGVNLPDLFFAFDCERTAGAVVEEIFDTARVAVGGTPDGSLARASDARLIIWKTLNAVDPMTKLTDCQEVSQGAQVYVKLADS